MTFSNTLFDGATAPKVLHKFSSKLTDLNKKFISKDGAVSSGVQLQQCLRQVRKVIYSI